MPYSKPFGRIFVENTPEQYCLGYHNSQKAREVSDETNTQVVAQMTNKCRIKIVQKELYNVRDPSWTEDRKMIEESTVAI